MGLLLTPYPTVWEGIHGKDPIYRSVGRATRVRKPHKAIDLEISPTRLSHNSVSGFGLLIDLPIPPQKKIGH